MSAPPEIRDLTDRFEQQLETYKSGSYNETQLRRDFLDPLFRSLGWDVDNAGGYAEAYRDVIHEDAIRIGGVIKAPDYCFRVGGTRKFFVEAKKPQVRVREEVPPAYQLRRYAWSAKLPLSILSDFEEFAVYDCRIKPAPTDAASTARVFYGTFREYAEKWDWIASVFSRESVLKGSFDKYAETNKAKRGTTEVDADFLASMEGWRNELARNLALRNPVLSTRELNFAVQRILDRIVFLRICEDRGLEHYGRLLALVNGPRIYPRLGELFLQADTRYNSGLFHFKAEKGRNEPPDALTRSLEVDDKLLRDLLKGLYYPESPYEFSVLSADILGQVYEQFLGKVIRLTDGHRAVVEEKPEVRKAGGVYYTPTYIVDYIVRETVGTLLKDKTPKDAAKLRVLDPACGSGSFLIGAYQHLLDWHLAWYSANEPEKWAKAKHPAIVPASARAADKHGNGAGDWRLTIAERKRILLNTIHGVDIDAAAVEVTKLSLLLKVLEGETEQTVQTMFDFHHERALPDLGENIKCGNSLIGSDFYRQQKLPEMDDDERLKLNVFDWDGPDGFAEIMKAGGFDAVIGNPPYVRQESLTGHKPYFQEHFKVYHGIADLYAYFIEKGITLLRTGGLFSYIVSNKWLRANYGEPLRTWLKGKWIEEIVDFGDLPVFKSATTYPCILRVSRHEPPNRNFVSDSQTGRRGGAEGRSPAPQRSEDDGGPQRQDPVARTGIEGSLKTGAVVTADHQLPSFPVTKVKTLDFVDLAEYSAKNQHQVSRNSLTNEGWSLADAASQAILDKIKSSGVPLGDYVNGELYYGIKTGLNEAFVIDTTTRERLIAEDLKSIELIKPFVIGRDIKRYLPLPDNQFLILIPKGWTRATIKATGDPWKSFRQVYPAIAAHLEPFRGAAEKRFDKGENWWELRACQYYDLFGKAKLFWPEIAGSAKFMLDENGYFSNNKVFLIPTGDRYLLGLLNSRLLRLFIHSVCTDLQGNSFNFSAVFITKTPVRVIDHSKKSDKAAHDQIVTLVDRMLSLHKQLAAAKTPHETTALERQIAATDAEIDRLVYQLYGLTEDEIRIVEGS